MWNWLETLSGGAATFIGSLTGSAIGLLALLTGALFNAHLNRKRDDRIIETDRRALATALRAELEGVRRTLLENAARLTEAPPDPQGGFYVPDLAHLVRILPHMLPKLGLLDSETIRKVIDANILVEQYCESLIMLDGTIESAMPEHRRVIFMPASRAGNVAAMNRNMARSIDLAITNLNECLQ